MSTPKDRERFFRSTLTGLQRQALALVDCIEAVLGDLPPSDDAPKCDTRHSKHLWASSRALQCNCGFVLREDR